MKPLVIELYIRGLTTDMNVLENQKNNENRENYQETERRMAQQYLKLADYVSDNVDFVRECLLSAFSLHPTEESFERIKRFAIDTGRITEDTNEEIMPKIVVAPSSSDNRQQNVGVKLPVSIKQEASTSMVSQFMGSSSQTYRSTSGLEIVTLSGLLAEHAAYLEQLEQQRISLLQEERELEQQRAYSLQQERELEQRQASSSQQEANSEQQLVSSSQLEEDSKQQLASSSYQKGESEEQLYSSLQQETKSIVVKDESTLLQKDPTGQSSIEITIEEVVSGWEEPSAERASAEKTLTSLLEKCLTSPPQESSLMPSTLFRDISSSLTLPNVVVKREPSEINEFTSSFNNEKQCHVTVNNKSDTIDSETSNNRVEPEASTLLKSESVNETANIDESDVLSNVLDSEKLGISSRLCEDLNVVLKSQRYHILNWGSSWKEFSDSCERYFFVCQIIL